jgi:membrane-associated phospholipid phosphatase
MIARRAARLVTDVLAPANVLIGLFILVGWHADDGLRGAAWGVAAAAACAGLPLAVVLVGVRRGWWTDVHVRIRSQRIVPLLVAIATDLAGLGLLAGAGAPRPLIALVLAVLCGLILGLAITTAWKISGHTGAAGAALTVLAVSYGPWLLAALPVVAIIGWARVASRDHTPAQVAGGFLLGVTAASAVFIPLH